MSENVSAIWAFPPPADFKERLDRCITEALNRRNGRGPATVFFRADDIGVPGRQFSRLMDQHRCHRVPLSLAIVPAWLTRPRWSALIGPVRDDDTLWCWHHHGWRHRNHEPAGKKQEFGPGRSHEALRADVIKGRDRLTRLLGDRFDPVFTPPWNRCDARTLTLLRDLGYAAVSRSRGSRPEPPPGLSDFPVNVDLHTRKETDPALGWANLFDEFGRAIAEGMCGIMIHHQRMNSAAFDFQRELLSTLADRTGIRLTRLFDLSSQCTTSDSP